MAARTGFRTLRLLAPFKANISRPYSRLRYDLMIFPLKLIYFYLTILTVTFIFQMYVVCFSSKMAVWWRFHAEWFYTGCSSCRRCREGISRKNKKHCRWNIKTYAFRSCWLEWITQGNSNQYFLGFEISGLGQSAEHGMWRVQTRLSFAHVCGARQKFSGNMTNLGAVYTEGGRS